MTLKIHVKDEVGFGQKEKAHWFSDTKVPVIYSTYFKSSTSNELTWSTTMANAPSMFVFNRNKFQAAL